uniref:Uncharacterized protein n=1 Tax=Moniliophthora roreri TaxID=221103 RepID=A0A0W0EVT3_MONRR
MTRNQPLLSSQVSFDVDMDIDDMPSLIPEEDEGDIAYDSDNDTFSVLAKHMSPPPSSSMQTHPEHLPKQLLSSLLVDHPINEVFHVEGLQEALTEFTKDMNRLQDEADNDLEGEQHSMGPKLDSEVETPSATVDAKLSDVLKGTSSFFYYFIHSDHFQYSLMNQFAKWCINKQYFKKGEEDKVFSKTPRRDMPELICAWIMDVCVFSMTSLSIILTIILSCDSINLDGTIWPKIERCASYTHAQKMQAAMTFGFGRVHELGNLPWHQSEISKEMKGNPSVSQQVSLYMVSLRRCKVQAGEEPTSAQAITADMIGKMFDFGRKPENSELKAQTQTHKNDNEDPHKWAGLHFCRLLHFIYTISFVCLLRIDEALQIRFKDVEIIDDHTIKLMLPFHKMNQTGKVPPFYIKAFPQQLQHLCPV